MALGRLLQHTGHFQRTDQFGESRNNRLDLLVLGYVLKMDAERENQRLSEDFKNRIFAHAFAHQNPDLFYEMYPAYDQRGGFHPSQGGEEWEVPQTEEELREMMARWHVGRVA